MGIVETLDSGVYSCRPTTAPTAGTRPRSARRTVASKQSMGPGHGDTIASQLRFVIYQIPDL